MIKLPYVNVDLADDDESGIAILLWLDGQTVWRLDRKYDMTKSPERERTIHFLRGQLGSDQWATVWDSDQDLPQDTEEIAWDENYKEHPVAYIDENLLWGRRDDMQLRRLWDEADDDGPPPTLMALVKL